MNLYKVLSSIVMGLILVILPCHSKLIGPLQAGLPNDFLGFSPITATPFEVLREHKKFIKDLSLYRGSWLKALKETNFPTGQPDTPSVLSQKLYWIFAQRDNQSFASMQKNYWSKNTNDESAALAAYVEGVLAGQKILPELAMQDFEKHITKELLPRAMERVLSTTQTLNLALEFPKTGSVLEKLIWVLSVHEYYPTNPFYHPSISEPEAAMFFMYCSGIIIKHNLQYFRVPLSFERKIIRVGSENRVYSMVEPMGMRRPSTGWPTIFFFHKSSKSLTPEQLPEHVKFAKAAASHGYATVFLVGSPQQEMSNYLMWGKGALGWPIDFSGELVKNDLFVKTLIQELSYSKAIDASKLYAVGNSFLMRNELSHFLNDCNRYLLKVR